MATINATITLTSPDLTSDALSISSTSTLSEAGVNTGLSQTDGLNRRTYATTVTNEPIALAANYTDDQAHKIYIKNLSTTAAEYVVVRIGATEVGRLYAQDWAFIPWSADTTSTAADIDIDTSATNMTVEWMVFVEDFA